MPGLTNPQPTKKLKLGKECLNACYFGNTALLMKLVEKGGDTSHMDPRDGWSGIHYAARWGKIKMLEVLVNSGVDINMRTTGKETALHKACRSNRKEVCIWMLRRGANPSLVNGDGCRAAEFATDKDIIFICENFEEFQEQCKQERETGRIKGRDTSMRNDIPSFSSFVSNQSFGSVDSAKIANQSRSISPRK